MKLQELAPVEATGSIRFAKPESLLRHVVKHCVLGRDERWHQVLGDTLVREARQQYREQGTGPALVALCDAYERAISDALVKTCQAGKDHAHLARYALEASGEDLEARAQVIDSWPGKERMVVGARALVRNAEVGPYRLTTAFRPHPRLSATVHRRRQRERLRQRLSLFALRLIEVHDDDK